METRFTLKDFVFLTLFLLVLGTVIFVGYQFSYQEERINGVKEELSKANEAQKQQLGVLAEIRNTLKAGIQVNGGQAGTQKSERVRRTNPDGSQYVYYPDVPLSPRNPEKNPDYSTGDWLIQNVGMEPKRITPFISQDMASQIIQNPVLETLVGQNPNTMEFEPALADWYEISADGLRFKFHIRTQACFSDGVALTADDVLFSFKTIMNEAVDCAALRSYYDKVKDCRKIDAQTVEFVMSDPYFLAMEFVGGLSIIPEHVYKFDNGEDFNRKRDVLVGSGPYKLEKWDTGKKITLVRNDKYWADRATFDRVEYVFIGEEEAQLQSFLHGDMDYLGEPYPPLPELYLKYSADPEFLKKFVAYKYPTPSSMYMYVGYNMAKPMFKDKETRQALTMLIDRKEIISKLMKGFGTEMTGPFSPQSPQNDATITPLAYDMDAAKKKLAAAGWKANADGVLERDGVKFEFDLSFRTKVQIRQDIAEYIQQQFKQAGIRMRLTPMESSVLFENFNERKFDACLAGWGGGGAEGDPKQIWHSSSIEDRGSNHVSFRNKETDALIEEGERTMDKAKRTEIWHKFQTILYDEQPYTWLYSEQDCAFVNGRFRNTEPYPTGLAPLDWYVPAAMQKYK